MVRRRAAGRALRDARSRASDVSARLLAGAERRTGLTPSGVAVLASGIAGLVLGRAIGSRALSLLAWGAVLAVGAAALLGRRRLDVVATRSDLPGRLREGQGVRVSIEVAARARLGGIVLDESLPDALGRPVRVPVPSLPAGSSVAHEYALAARRRGVHSVGPLVAEWTDPFGLTRRRRTLAEATTVVVHPSTEALLDRVTSREWEDPPLRPPRARPWPSGFELHGLRDYVSGDDPRRIVWRATARTLDGEGGGRYLVREAEQGVTDRVRLWLDTDRTELPGEAGAAAFEAAVRTAASLVERHLGDGFSVSIEGPERPVAGPARGRPGRIPLLDALAAIQLDRSPLTASLDRLLSQPRRADHHVVITPHLSSAAATRLRLLVERGASLVLVLVRGPEADPASVHRAATIGCPVVEVQPGVALDRLFRRAVAVR